LVLIVAPWSGFWDRNFFVARLPSLAELFGSPIARGAVSGVGLVTTLAGLAEFGAAFSGRRPRPEASSGATLHPDG
jgi:hypothetical protein